MKQNQRFGLGYGYMFDLVFGYADVGICYGDGVGVHVCLFIR